MTRTANRRAILKGAPAAAVALAIPFSAQAMVTADRTAWERALAAYRRIEAEDAEFSPVYHRTWAACREECERVPHVVFERSDFTGRPHVSTADVHYVQRCRSDLADLAAGKVRFDPLPELQNHERQMRELVEAADSRAKAVQAIRDRYGMDALDDRSDALGDALADGQGVLLNTPAPDLAALRWKIDYITEGARAPDGSLDCYGHQHVAQLLVDVERLMPSVA